MYPSITTPSLQVSAETSFLEILYVKEYGSLPVYPWRKHSQYQTTWSKRYGLLRHLVSRCDICLEELLNLVLNKIGFEKFDWKYVGLIKWHIKNSWYERECLSQIIDSLCENYKSIAPEVNEYTEGKIKNIKDLIDAKES